MQEVEQRMEHDSRDGGGRIASGTAIELPGKPKPRPESMLERSGVLKTGAFFEMDTGLGFGFLRRSTSCVHAVVRWYDVNTSSACGGDFYPGIGIDL